MVRIEHTKADLTQFAEDHYEFLRQAPYDIEGKLLDFTRVAGGSFSNEHQAYALLLKNNLKNIVTGWPDELDKIKPTLTRAFNKILKAIDALPLSKDDKKKARAKYKNHVVKIFNYKKFTDEYDEYGAYSFVKKLGVNVCPYCNRQYVFTLNNKTGKTRAELDHFLDKGKNLHFGLSFFNLVPSCHTCNSNLKGTKPFTNKRYLNPYVTCFNDVLDFSIEITTEDFINGKAGSFKVTQKPAVGALKSEVIKAKRNASVFQHAELYNNHQDLVVELLHKAYYYTKSRRKELANLRAPSVGSTLGKKLFKTDAEVNRFITGSYTEVAELGKRPMSKLIRDIGKELKLL